MEIGADEDAPEFTWAIGEWAYEAAESDSFNPLCKKLAGTVPAPNFPEAKFDVFFEDLQSDMIEALRLLDQEGLFGTGAEREKITLFVTISDDDGSVEPENNSAKVLNPPSVFDRFIKRYD